MSRYNPKKFDTTLNHSQDHPLKEFLAFTLKGIAALTLVYILIGASLDFFIMRISIEKEQWLWQKSHLVEIVTTDDLLKDEQNYVQRVFDKIPAEIKSEGYNFKVIVTLDDEPNAFALPGGTIVVTTGMLSFLETENALTFILGHELGHFKHRDHLRGMGFNLAASAILLTISTQEPSIVKVASGLFGVGNLSYSRKQEIQADETGIETARAVYGHAAGATNFFEKLKEQRTGIIQKLDPLLSTHPSDQKRINRLTDTLKTTDSNSKTLPIKKFSNKLESNYAEEEDSN